MSEIVKYFLRQAKFKDQNEAVEIRQKLESLVNNILALVEKQDKRFQCAPLIHSGSVYEGVKVHQPDEFDFMITLTDLNISKSLLRKL